MLNCMSFQKWALAVIALFLVVLPLVVSTGCSSDEDIPFLPYTSKTSEILVPSTPLDLFVYAKQQRPTVIPAQIAGISHDVDVESLTIWGVPGDRDFAFGMALRFVAESTAQDVFDQMKLETGDWKRISNKTIFIVRGTGTAAKLLKSAIEQEDFGMYTDVKVLEAVQTLPNGSRAKMVAVGIAKPSSVLIDTIRPALNRNDFEKLTKTLRMADAQLVAGGLYSMYRIDIAEVMGMLVGKGNFSNLDTGFLFMLKSGLPGFVFQPILRNYLLDNKFKEVKTKDYPIYKGSWDLTNASKLHALIRIDGSYAYAAVAGKESYAETLITNIRK